MPSPSHITHHTPEAEERTRGIVSHHVIVRIRYQLSNSGAAKQGDTGAPEGDLPQREKHPPTTLERIFVWRNDVPPHLREVIRDHRVFRRGRAGMTTPRVLSTAAPNLVDGMMASHESDTIACRHRFRRRRARLAPSSRPILLWPLVTRPIKRSFTVANSETNRETNKRETKEKLDGRSP